MVLVVQDYIALLILNRFFILYDLVISINFSYKVAPGSYDVLSISKMILIGFDTRESESQIAVLLQQNIILVTVASILGIGFMSYIYIVRRKYLLSWYLVSVISIFAISGLSITFLPVFCGIYLTIV
ncbi:hypothetical protein DASC09_010610 [Saccharomycopsis crataegensis]|uniref:Uncharacterized protein n=1 Tax=Saccharomycopsis crataegensis TaxID=43959 RepID=A0AAV5QGL0_9ASCO|nr:hypothetical protein DASC09_010610 [Saccharomycopsis crataegensis]